MIRKHINEAVEFHEKFNLGINIGKQTGMFERNNLLFEEVGELLEAFDHECVSEMKSEALDVYYILMGNCAYLGVEDFTVQYNFEEEFCKGMMNDTIFNASKLAQYTRKKFDDDNYVELMIERMQIVIELIFAIFDSPEEFALLFASHHNRMMNKTTKKIGDVVVVSNFN